jgi:hypothetical protein
MADLPQPAVVALSATLVGGGTLTGNLTVTLGAATETDTALPVVVAVSGAAEVDRTATSSDYGLVLVPFGMGLNLFGVLATVADPTTGAVWGVALFLVTIIAMRDREFSKLVARFADSLKPPSD